MRQAGVEAVAEFGVEQGGGLGAKRPSEVSRGGRRSGGGGWR